ncbi:hypothetical protein PROFUN_16016 [Planoprotostelium fungivorum]|uniref:Uncharacterized protein n=1 Tax=Planoprotostelium fungivorum TaxID=1890364 RepID=A0A2P6MT68_9EUKA|nr:hypothetical protein PROFUN_16016 [Planoprotostelium fungivorum]
MWSQPQGIGAISATGTCGLSHRDMWSLAGRTNKSGWQNVFDARNMPSLALSFFPLVQMFVPAGKIQKANVAHIPCTTTDLIKKLVGMMALQTSNEVESCRGVDEVMDTLKLDGSHILSTDEVSVYQQLTTSITPRISLMITSSQLISLPLKGKLMLEQTSPHILLLRLLPQILTHMEEVTEGKTRDDKNKGEASSHHSESIVLAV